MAEKTFPFLVPVYYKDFQCIGSACEDNCCKEWTRIYVDKKAYNKIKNLRPNNVDKDFFEKLSCISRTKHEANVPNTIKDEEYAYITFDPDTKKCPMLSAEGLCNVYINLGEEYMCKTCKVFPRLISLYGTGNSAALSCSCHEVVRKAIYNEDGLDFEYIDIPMSQIKLYHTTADFRKEEDQKTFRKYYEEIRNFMIDILQCRLYSMDDRMSILGIFSNKLNNTPLDEIPDVIKTYSGLLNVGAFNEHLSRLETDNSVHKLILNNLINSLSNLSGNFEIIRTIRKDIQDALNANDNILDYTNLHKFMDKNSYMFENYMVNFLFSEPLFFFKFDHFFDIYVAMAFVYTYLKYILGAMLMKYPDIETKKLTDAFVAMDRILSHNTDAIILTVNSIIGTDCYNLASMITIVKN